jgi:hypothetical protein
MPPNWAWPSPGRGVFHGILLAELSGPTGLFSGGVTHPAKPMDTAINKRAKKRIMAAGQ